MEQKHDRISLKKNHWLLISVNVDTSEHCDFLFLTAESFGSKTSKTVILILSLTMV